MVSGSYREGFGLSGSDIDYMFWSNEERVIWDFSHCQLYNTQDYTLIICDSSESPPGFTLLWLPSQITSRFMRSACLRMNDRLFLSSLKYREMYVSLYGKGYTTHGPCTNFLFLEKKHDNAHCFISDFWPPSAIFWIDRCHSWPPPHVVNDIVKIGCHFVAI